VTETLADRREQEGVHRGYPERGVPVPQHAVGAVVLPATVDLSVAMADPAAGDRLRRHLVSRPLKRADLFPVEDAAQGQYPVAMELADLLVSNDPRPPISPDSDLVARLSGPVT